MKSGGAAIVKAFQDCGVDTVFGIPGTHNLEIYRYLSLSDIHHVTPRHEQGAGYAADGYARASGKPGVCVTTSGPGLTNITTAAATAYADSVPLFIISPGVPRGMVGKDVGWLHEMKNQQAHMENVVATSRRVESASEAAAFINQTFATWPTIRPRPVHLEVPVDVLEGTWDEVELPHEHPISADVSPERIAQAANLLRRGSVVMLVGGGSKDVGRPLVDLAERLGSPVITTVNGKGAFPENHPLSLGSSIRLTVAQDIVSAAEVALLIGTEAADTDLWGGQLTPSGEVIRIDIDPGQLDKNVGSTLALLGDARQVVALLADALGDLPRKPLTELEEQTAQHQIRVREASQADGALWVDLHAALAKSLPSDSIISGDSSQVTYYGTVHLWSVPRPRQFLYPTGYATLGYGLPAAIGAKVAHPARPVVALIGDGAFMFSMNELATARELRLGLPIIVVKNGGFAEIRQQMDERGIGRLGVDLEVPDLAGLAGAFGAHSHQLNGYDTLPTVIADALNADFPTIIEVDIG